MSLRIERLASDNFEDYEVLTACGDDGTPCYCAFWHLKVAGMADYDAIKARDPLILREIVRSRVTAGFHVGALAYDAEALVAWISIAPMPEVYWCWPRVAAVGAAAENIAAITCLTLASSCRGQGRQPEVASALREHGRAMGWEAIEAYPFDESLTRTRSDLLWPGVEPAYRAAGYERIGSHWLSRPDLPRSVMRIECSRGADPGS